MRWRVRRRIDDDSTLGKDGGKWAEDGKSCWIQVGEIERNVDGGRGRTRRGPCWSRSRVASEERSSRDSGPRSPVEQMLFLLRWKAFLAPPAMKCEARCPPSLSHSSRLRTPARGRSMVHPRLEF
jgi:hypothetical protein